MNMLFMTPPPTHFVYIPVILLVGAVIGYVIGRQAGIKDAVSHYIDEVASEDDDLI